MDTDTTNFVHQGVAYTAHYLTFAAANDTPDKEKIVIRHITTKNGAPIPKWRQSDKQLSDAATIAVKRDRELNSSQ